MNACYSLLFITLSSLIVAMEQSISSEKEEESKSESQYYPVMSLQEQNILRIIRLISSQKISKNSIQKLPEDIRTIITFLIQNNFNGDNLAELFLKITAQVESDEDKKKVEAHIREILKRLPISATNAIKKYVWYIMLLKD